MLQALMTQAFPHAQDRLVAMGDIIALVFADDTLHVNDF